MNLSTRQKANLYIAVFAAVHAKLVKNGEVRSAYACAHLAREHATVAVTEAMKSGKRSSK